MSNLDVTRSVRFVSLDTHPANNSLVVTYEILVTVSDPHSKQELSRRTKRDQLQISISELDKKGAGDLKKLSNQDTSQALEEIQLHLLYLFNRKRYQIHQATKNPERPASAASGRLRSATPTGSGARLPTARQGSARDGRRSSLSARNEHSTSLDCYTTFCENELKASRGCTASDEQEQDVQEEFLQQFLQHLSAYDLGGKADKNSELDAQLEGLYGDLNEKIAAMSSIFSLVKDDQKLMELKPDRLLVTAILRTLQDSEARDARLSGLILYCLVRFTLFQDVYDRVFNQGEPIDFLRVAVDLLEDHSRLASKADELRPILSKFHHLNSVLTIVNNLICLDELGGNNNFRKKLFQLHGKRLAGSLISLYVTISRHLARDLRSQSANRYKRLTLVLANLIKLTRSLSIFREFINLLRVQSQTLTESLINCISTLQLSRPGSGSVVEQASDSSRKEPKQQAIDDQFFVRDRLILCEIYQLEIELLKLVNNLIYDTRFKLRFSRKSLLLKCVLRNLVVFLASSRRSNTLAPFDRSSVLLVPFKCLYELSCQQSTIDELFKSKIVLKCLLEFLLSSTADLKTLLDSFSAAYSGRETAPKNEKDLLEEDQIILNPQHASHYILSIWINLSAKKTAPFFASEVNRELSEPICDYLNLANMNLETSIQRIANKTEAKSGSPIFQDAQLDVYLHAKLLRNLTQFLKFHQSEPMLWAEQFARWIEQQARSLDRLLSMVRTRGQDPLLLPLMTECVGTLTNLTANADSLWGLDEEVSNLPLLDWPRELSSILNQLLDISLAGSSGLDGGENDDLLLVSINLVGALARSREICNELNQFTSKLTSLCNFVLEAKSSDVEMLVSCLFALCHLLNHWTFLKSLGSDLDDQRPEVVLLIDRLSSLVMHADPAISRLANIILNTLKQFEEQQSLADSVACERRFICYNEKWLSAIRANRDEPSASLADAETTLLLDKIDRRGRELVETNDDEFSQLRTVVLNEESTASSSRMSTSSSNRSSALTFGPASTRTGQQEVKEDELDDDEELEGAEQQEQEEDEEEETFSEPDLNVIDANSMIKHLRNRREFRAELTAMRRA